jgi:hypothetical protein
MEFTQLNNYFMPLKVNNAAYLLHLPTGLKLKQFYSRIPSKTCSSYQPVFESDELSML